MAIIFGMRDTGKNGVLSHAELLAMIRRKSGQRANETACGRCATHIQNMTSTADQGGITTKYAGRSVFHISSGRRGSTDGASVFFTLSESVKTARRSATGKDQCSIVAGIVAVGWHHNGSDHVYRLDWGKGAPFFTKGLLDTSRQHQAAPST